MQTLTPELPDTIIKPGITLWVRPTELIAMQFGEVPNSWHLSKPENTNTEFVQIIVHLAYFEILWKERKQLDEDTADLPF